MNTHDPVTQEINKPLLVGFPETETSIFEFRSEYEQAFAPLGKLPEGFIEAVEKGAHKDAFHLWASKCLRDDEAYLKLLLAISMLGLAPNLCGER